MLEWTGESSSTRPASSMRTGRRSASAASNIVARQAATVSDADYFWLADKPGVDSLVAISAEFGVVYLVYGLLVGKCPNGSSLP
jgi:hypothetical protein